MDTAQVNSERGCRVVVLEERYAYYRRCQAVRKNGVQCKAPALKGERVCCKHQRQKEMRERWERQRAGLGLPRGFDEPRAVLRALQIVGQALIDCRLDEKPARRMAWELSLVLWVQTRLPQRHFRLQGGRQRTSVKEG